MEEEEGVRSPAVDSGLRCDRSASNMATLPDDGCSLSALFKSAAILAQAAADSLKAAQGNIPAREQSESETTHHRQLETLRTEEHMGGAYVTHRRRSPSSSTDALSPLLSEERDSIKPIALSPKRKGSACFANTIVHLVRRKDPNSDTEEKSRFQP